MSPADLEALYWDLKNRLLNHPPEEEYVKADLTPTELEALLEILEGELPL